jgi:hypothetical protein
MSSKEAVEYVKEHIRRSSTRPDAGWSIQFPVYTSYPGSGVPVTIDGRVLNGPANVTSLVLLEIEYEFNMEVARREKAKAKDAAYCPANSD